MVSSTVPQSALLAEAIRIVADDPGLYQEEIEALLEAQYPGKPNFRYYANPAAEAMMQHIRKEHQARLGLEADKARLRAKGLPEHLAGRQPSVAPQRPQPAQVLQSIGEYE